MASGRSKRRPHLCLLAFLVRRKEEYKDDPEKYVRLLTIVGFHFPGEAHNARKVLTSDYLGIFPDAKVRAGIQERLKAIGSIRDVAGDGNCGYHVLKLGLKFRESIADFRRNLREYATTHKHLLTDIIFGDAGSERLFSEFLDSIYQIGVNFDDGAAQPFWLDGGYTLPIVALKYNVDIVTYAIFDQFNVITQWYRVSPEQTYTHKQYLGIEKIPASSTPRIKMIYSCSHWQFLDGK